ncbi:hypothetical protein JCM8097_001316 [Rhodosporidiobolus ruineniae]
MGLDTARFAVEGRPEWATCPVCFDAATDPHTVCSSEHIVCGACVATLQQPRLGFQRPECPTCRRPLKPKPSLVLKRILEEYKVVCSRKKRGCKYWEGNLSGEEKHRTQECQYRTIACPACRKDVIASQLGQHEYVCPQQVPNPLTVANKEQLPFRLRTKTTYANMRAHEEGCRDRRAQIKLLTAENARLKAAAAGQAQPQAGPSTSRAAGVARLAVADEELTPVKPKSPVRPAGLIKRSRTSPSTAEASTSGSGKSSRHSFAEPLLLRDAMEASVSRGTRRRRSSEPGSGTAKRPKSE